VQTLTKCDISKFTAIWYGFSMGSTVSDFQMARDDSVNSSDRVQADVSKHFSFKQLTSDFSHIRFTANLIESTITQSTGILICSAEHVPSVIL
jgi:hypothetical protein